MSWSIIRFALTLRAFAKRRTWAATFGGKLMLCRAGRFAILMPPLCTKLVSGAAMPTCGEQSGANFLEGRFAPVSGNPT